MPFQILMPALSPTMTEGNIVRWLKKVGDNVTSGEIIVEIETDKATMEVESGEDGTLHQILAPQGSENVKINSPIGIILLEGETPHVADPLLLTENPDLKIKPFKNGLIIFKRSLSKITISVTRSHFFNFL